MLITRKEIDFLAALYTTRVEIALESIPSTFRPDFDAYFFGKTLMEKDDILFAFPHDIKHWVRFMF